MGTRWAGVGVGAVALVLLVSACKTMWDGLTAPPMPSPAAMPIDFVVDLQPIFVADEWNAEALGEQTARLAAAFAQAGVAFRVLDAIYLDKPEWETIHGEAQLRQMMSTKYSGIEVWLVRELYDGRGGFGYPPTEECCGVTLAVGATRDANTLVHEMGHAMGLDHPAEGADACALPDVRCRFMSYCYPTRNQFTADEIQTLRRWAAEFSAANELCEG